MVRGSLSSPAQHGSPHSRGLTAGRAPLRARRVLGEQHGYNLRRWRRAQEAKGGKEWGEGFAVLDAEGGAGGDLACQRVQYNPRDR